MRQDAATTEVGPAWAVAGRVPASAGVRAETRVSTRFEGIGGHAWEPPGWTPERIRQE